MAIKFLNTVAVDDDVLFVDTTNDLVGIGTTSPSSQLHVKGNVVGGNVTTRFEPQANNAQSTLYLSSTGSGDGGYYYNSNNNDAGLFSYGDYTFNVGTANISGTVGNPRMVIKQGGNVGIGTTNPDTKLSVVGETSTNNLIGGSINLATSYGWTIPSGTFTQRVGYYGGDFTLNGSLTENSMERGLGPFKDRQLLWTTIGSTDSNSDGGWNKTLTNLDINSSYLSVVYFKRTSSEASGTFYHGTGNNILNLNGTANTNPYFSVRALSDFEQNVWYVSVGVIQSNSDSNTTAYTDISGLYRLDTGAKVSNANAYKFDTDGATLSRGHRAYLYYSTDVGVVSQFANPGFYKIDGDQPKLHDIIGSGTDDAFWSASGDDIYNDNSGNVGIGIVSPIAKLDVDGAIASKGGTYIATNGTVTDAAYIVKQNNKIYSEAGSGYLRNLIYHDGNGSIQIGQDGTGLITDIVVKPGTSGNVIFRTSNNSETVRISSSGNVGIGNTSPIFPLDITGVINIDNTGTGAPIILNSSSTNSGGNFLHAKKSDGSNQWVFGANNGGDDRVTIRQYNPASIVFQNNAGEAMVINSSANVGIGTTIPNQKLEVSAATDTAISIASSDTSINASQNVGILEFSSNNETSLSQAYTPFSKIKTISEVAVTGTASVNGAITFETAQANTVSEKMRITSDGKVGIGTTTPAHALDVSGRIQTGSDGLQIDTGSYGLLRIRSFFGALNTSTSLYVGGVNGYSYQPVYASAFNVNSDYRLKTNVTTLEKAVERVKQLNVHRFNWKDSLEEEKVDGFLAHELAEVIPEAVTGEKDAVREDGTFNYQGVDQSKVVPLLTAALQEAIEKIEQLELRIQTLENN